MTCLVCGDVKTETIEALGHTEEAVAGKAATCTESGLTDGKKCSVCAEVLAAQETIEALGHSYSEATCTKKATCSVCNAETGELADHVDASEDGKCDVCQYQMSTPVESTTVESTTVESTPVESTPVESTPEESTPAESTPVESIPEETTPNEEEPKEGLSGGAVAGIVAGSTVVACGGGFAIWWFAIRNRAATDIGAGVNRTIRRFRRK